VGAVLYLAVVAGMVFVLISVFTPYLVRQPSRGGVSVAVNPSVLATWQGPEQTAFAGVLRQFQQQHAIDVTYQSAGQDLPLWLDNSLAQGTPPDVAFLPQPGELADLARRGILIPLDGVVDRRQLADMNGLWRSYASWNGRLYGVYFKTSDKSVIWYRPDLFRAAHIQGVPATWADLLTDVGLLRNAGITPFAMCGSSAWTLTDWFENLYLRSAGPAMYENLARHDVRWTDPSVARALGLMAQVFDPDDMAGGRTGSLTTQYPDCVNTVFARGSRTAMVFEGDFVQNQIQSLGRRMTAGPNGDYDFFRFPAVDPRFSSGVIVGGDAAVMLRNTPQARELINYLATPEAGRLWARQGGFISPHASVRGQDYPGPLARTLATAVTGGGAMLEFDMSDQAPAAFGSTVGAGEWDALQQWLSDPSAIQQTQERLERDAEQAYAAS
jgi:ABC-type glycerol-3-phosphate transport system substrate-binding protein